MISPIRNVRSDARSNRDAIIEAAVTTLSGKPRASIADIAAAAGVSRGTLYAHFSNRRTLVSASFRWLMGRVDDRLSDIDPALPLGDYLDELVSTSWWMLGHFAGMATAAKADTSSTELRRMHDEPLRRITELLGRGRDAGAFRSDQDLEWQAECFYAVLQAGASRMRIGHAQPVVATEMVTTIRAMLATRLGESGADSPEPRPRPDGRP